MAYKTVTISLQPNELMIIRECAKKNERTLSWVFKTGALKLVMEENLNLIDADTIKKISQFVDDMKNVNKGDLSPPKE